MKRLLAVAAMAVTMIAVTSTAVHAAPPPPSGNTYSCIGTSVGDCMNENGQAGKLVYTKEYVTNETEFSVLPAYDNQGVDHVDGNGTNGPFPDGDGFNATYDGKLLVHIFNTHENSMCITADTYTQGFDQLPCDAANNSLFVQVGSGPYTFVSVGNTAAYGTLLVAGDAGNNQPLTTYGDGPPTEWTETPLE